MMSGAGGAASGSRPRMRHQRRARLVRVRGVVVGGGVELAPGGPQAVECARCRWRPRPWRRPGRSRRARGSRRRSRASRRAAAAPASRGVEGSAPAAVKSARMSLVAVARSQRRSPGRRLAWRASMRDSSSWRAAWHQFARSLVGDADLGVGGVGALVDQGAPGDRVALAVGGDGGVGGRRGRPPAGRRRPR